MHDYDPEIPSNAISEDKIFLEACPQTPQHQHAFIMTHHPIFSVHTVLRVVGLTTENLLPTALNAEVKLYWHCCTFQNSDEEGDPEESDTDVPAITGEFHRHLGKVDWCICSRCIPMPHGIKHKHCIQSNGQCVWTNGTR